AGRNGIPATIFVTDFTHPLVAQNGVVLFAQNALLPSQAPQLNGLNITIDSNGNIVPEYMGVPTLSPGTLLGGGDRVNSFTYDQNIIPAIERRVANVISHYDLTDRVKLYGEFLAARIKTTETGYDKLFSQYQPTFFFFP